MPRLLIHHASESVRVLELAGERPLSIGRAKSSNLVLDHASVSRLHAVVRATPDGKWEIIDRGSVNGVLINGRAAKEATLQPNDEIAIGDYKLRFEDSAARQVMAYGTVQLPPRVAQALSQSHSAYSSSLHGVTSLADVSLGDSGAAGAGRAQGPQGEKHLLNLLSRVNGELAALQTVNEVVARGIELALEVDGAERGYAMLLDGESMERRYFEEGNYSFEPAVIRYRAGSKEAGGRNATPLVLSQSIIRQAMRSGLPLLIADAQDDPRLSKSQSVVLAGIRSAMCAPLGVGDRRRGLLYVDNLSKRGMFSVGDLNVFAVIAVQVGLAIERIRSRAPASATPGRA